jgi:cytochrome c2
MKNFLAIAAFALAVSLFYTGIGQILPQLENRPPASIKVGETVSPDDLVTAGAGVFEANCAQCHKIGQPGGRCPDLGGVGQRAGDRAKEAHDKNDLEYLLQSMCDPGHYVVAGFGNIMPAQAKLLSPGQLLAAAAFLQDQGGTVTVNLSDRAASDAALSEASCPTSAGAAAPAAPVAAAAPVGPPEQIFTTFGCSGCHSIDKDVQIVGPSLMAVGKRLEEGKIYESVLDPDAVVAPGFTKGMMKATLSSNGFYDRMKPEDYRALVQWLASHKG